ncbi:MAG TPA: glutathione S-transferase N-terminal domain-containing protein [Burkholderiales bacterium]
MKLLASLASPYTRKVRIFLAEKKIECDLELVDVGPVDNPVNPHNPLGKIPTLVLDDGSALYDSRVIVEFLDAVSPIGRLIPDDMRERVAARRWEALADGVTDAGILIRSELQRDKKERSKAWTDKQLARMQRGMAQMSTELGERALYLNDKYSLADIAVGCCVGWLGFRNPGDIDWHTEYPALARHYARLMERPPFADTVPQVPK